ncbi:hypothetical protein BKA69DRAFT_1031238 [Paraphysoderma sedebokerense]|nr:hypothetical protein BKA69DRAFT_1031238 [Paraphysoderma sedebokerense]
MDAFNRFLPAVPPTPSEFELATLAAISDTLFAQLTPEESSILLKESKSPLISSSDLSVYSQLSGSQLTPPQQIFELARKTLPDTVLKKLWLAIRLLSSSAGVLLLTAKYARPFPELSREEREDVFAILSNSPLLIKRLMFKGLQSVFLLKTYSPPETTSQHESLHKLLKYSTYAPSSSPEIKPSENLDHDFNFIHIPDSNSVVELSTDVVIVGSGAGGGVTASILARAGLNVIVVEKGKYYKSHEIPGSEGKGFDSLYQNGGLFTSDDGGINILAGSTFGGGTTVNWCASLIPQHFLRQEWASQGLGHFLSPAFQKSVEAAVSGIGVSTSGIEHNRANQMFMDGCKKLGMHIVDIPQNTRDEGHACGWCPWGCKQGRKQSSAQTFLVDADKHGAKFIQNCYIDKILISELFQKNTAVGVVGRVNSTPIKINAKIVVSSAGALNTPALLLRSGLKNKNIGKNLRLHPVGLAMGYFPDQEIKSWEGACMTTLKSRSTARCTPYYGSKLEVPSIHVAGYSVNLPWQSALNHKIEMSRLPHLLPIISLSRDRDSLASVEIDETGSPKVLFDISDYDKGSVLEGIVKGIEVLVALGAKEVKTSQSTIPWFKPTSTSLSDPNFVKYINHVKSVGVEPIYTGLFSAHQMGTAKMGVNPKTSVIAPNGECWEVSNLFVADASTFPTASGVNPMVTIYSICHSIGKFILAKQGLLKSNDVFYDDAVEANKIRWSKGVRL